MAPPQWAYQIENFVSEPDEELVCSICRAVFCDPVMCPCDHVFCQACITKWVQSSRNCPICRKRVSSSSVKQAVPIVKNIIMKLMLNCHNKSLGCTAQFSVESSETHVKECQYELVQCKNKPCKDRLFRKDIKEHETIDCPHRSIKCKTCRLKLPTSALPGKHDCIQELQDRLRKKNNMIRKRNETIKDLTNEITALKSASQGSQQSLSDASHDFGNLSSSLSPEDIMINITEYDSTSSSSLSSDSENLSDDSIIIFTNSSPMRSHNMESDSFMTFMDDEDSVEYSRSESPRNFNEYRNAESQTTDELPMGWLHQSIGLGFNGNDNMAEESPSTASAIALPNSEENEERFQTRRPGKRRPTTQKPAKRRFPHSASSSDVGEPAENSSLHSPGPSTSMAVDEPDHAGNPLLIGNGDNRSASNQVAIAGPSGGSTWDFNDVKFTLFPPIKQKRTRHTNSPVENTEGTSVAPSRNAVFERTLALLEQYSLESDPEWLPEHASHRGDTTSESDTSNEEAVSDSSTSELSDGDEENSNGNLDASISDLVHRTFDNSSDEDEDPDYHPPIKCMSTRGIFAPRRT